MLMYAYPTRSIAPRIGVIIAVVIRVDHRHWCASRSVTSMKSNRRSGDFAWLIRSAGSLRLEDDQRLPVLHGLSVLDEDLANHAAHWRGNRVHELHHLDDAHGRLDLDNLTHFDERPLSRRGRTVEGADHRRAHDAPMLGPGSCPIASVRIGPRLRVGCPFC